MLKMSKTSEEFLRKYLPEFFDYGDNLRGALLELDAFITREGLDSNDDMTDFGHEATAVYDDIFYSN